MKLWSDSSGGLPAQSVEFFEVVVNFFIRIELVVVITS